MQSIDSVRAYAEETEGWLASDAGEFLFELARNNTGAGVIVEAGAWMGRTTIWLAAGSKAGPHVPVFAIDPHSGSREHRLLNETSTFETFKSNIKRAGVDDIVRPVLGTSADAASIVNEPVEIFFTDWPYDYDQAYGELRLWFPRLIPGGWFVLNNTISYPGPTRVARQLLRSGHIREPKFIRGITAVQKVPNIGRRDHIYNRYVLMLRDTYRLGSQLTLPGPVRAAGRSIARKLH